MGEENYGIFRNHPKSFATNNALCDSQRALFGVNRNQSKSLLCPGLESNAFDLSLLFYTFMRLIPDIGDTMGDMIVV